MNPTIELIYSQDCPNVDVTRARLQEVLARIGLASRWQEWDRESAGAPAHVRGYGSPTVLVDGRDVGEAAAAEADCCRVYPGEGRFEGAPSTEVLESAIRGARRGAREG